MNKREPENWDESKMRIVPEPLAEIEAMTTDELLNELEDIQ